MGDDHHGGVTLGLDLHEKIVDLACCNSVQSAGGLIHEKDLRLKYQGPRQTGSLLHASRESRRQLLAILLQTNLSQSLVHCAVDFILRLCAVKPMEWHGKVLIYSKGVKEGRALKEKTHFSTNLNQPVFIQSGHVRTFDQDSAGIGIEQTDHQLQGYALAGSAASQDA